MLNKNKNKPSLLNWNFVANKTNLHIYSYSMNITYSPFVELFSKERKKTVGENRKQNGRKHNSVKNIYLANSEIEQ